MVKIAFITPDPSMTDAIRQIYEEHSREYEKESRDPHEYDFSIYAAANYKSVPQKALEADIIISRGLLAAQLKKAVPDTALVEVPIGSELLASVCQAVKVHGNLPIAVMGAFNMVYSSHGIDEVLGVDIKAYLQTSNEPEYIRGILAKVFADNRHIILCGANTYPEVTKHDCHPFLVGMSRMSIWQAISEAKHGALIRRREGERAEQFRTVLNYAWEGVIATDAQGIINVFNAAAADILHIRNAVGRQIEDVAPSGHLGALFREKADCTDRVIPYKGEVLSANKVSIFLHGDFTGHIITLQKSSAIQKTESIIRRQLYAKGHVARYTFDDIIGESQPIKTAIHSARNYSAVTSNIMIVGDTGTGKEIFAQGIHNQSDRREAPFVAINCAALSKSLLESELFGYAEGAFTGAIKGGKPGIFEIAHTGTIFLDEISEIPLDVQARLLRVLQERQIMRLGDDKVIPIDVRIICAANKPLLQEVRNGRFRKDLYYRLAVLTLNLPELNARGGDILRLAKFFIREYCEKFHKPEIVMSEAACARLVQHRWEGNIRELRNMCECLVVLNESGVLAGEDLATHFASEVCAPTMDEGTNYAEELRLFNRERIVEALDSCGGNKVRAAKKLGVSKATIWRWIKKMEIEK